MISPESVARVRQSFLVFTVEVQSLNSRSLGSYHLLAILVRKPTRLSSSNLLVVILRYLPATCVAPFLELLSHSLAIAQSG